MSFVVLAAIKRLAVHLCHFVGERDAQIAASENLDPIHPSNHALQRTGHGGGVFFVVSPCVAMARR